MVEFNIQHENGKSLNLTEEQIQEIISLYKSGVSLVELCKITGIKAPQTIRNILKKNQIEIKGFRYKYPLKENYFENIDNFEKAYWLGLLYADGAIQDNRFSIRLNLIDKEHIEKFRQAIGAINNKVGEVVDKRFSSPCKIYYVSVKSRKMFNDLVKWGCTPRKSLTINFIPDIEKTFVPAFIRGYFDGDGSIHQTGKAKAWRISFTGTKEFLENIQEELGTRVKITKGPNEAKDYVFQVMGKYQLKRILDYLYQDSTLETRLNRKYAKYLDFLNELGASLSNL